MPATVLETPQALKEFIGKEVGLSDWMVVTEERIASFAEATGDRQWIHLDTERAKRESPYGATIAHGFLTLSLLSHFVKTAIDVRCAARLTVNYGLNRVRFPSPVRAGTRVRGRFTLLSWKELNDAQEAVFACTVEAQGSEKPCCVAEWILRYYK